MSARLLLFVAGALLASVVHGQTISDIAKIDFTFTVLGMDIENYGSDFVKTFTLNSETPSFRLGAMPHGQTTITAKAYDGSNVLIYESVPFSEDFDSSSATATLVLQRLGFSDVTSDHNICPILLSWTISPMNLRPGRDTTISYTTFDPDGENGSPTKVELEIPQHQAGVTDGVVKTDYAALDDPQDVTPRSDHRYGYGSRVLNLDGSQELDGTTLLPRDTAITITANDTQGCAAPTNDVISTKIIPAVSDQDVNVVYAHRGLLSVTAQGDTSATDSSDDVTAGLVFQEACDGNQVVQTAISCVLVGTTTPEADGGTVTHNINDVTCAANSGTSSSPLLITLPFVPNTASGAMCTATFTIVSEGTTLTQTNTFKYFSGSYTTRTAHEPEIDFVFISRTAVEDDKVIALVVDFRSVNPLGTPSWTCLGQNGGSVYETSNTLNFDENDGSPFSETLVRTVKEVTIRDASQFVQAGTNCTATVSDGTLSVSKVFNFNEDPFVYVSMSPTPAPSPAPSQSCDAPVTCSTRSISETSQSTHMYVQQPFDAHALPAGSVIAVHTQDAHIFGANLGIDAQHAVDNCAEIEARVAAVSVDQSGNIYHIQIEQLYYDGAWHNTSGIVGDATSLTETVFRVVSRPLISTGFIIELRDCQSNAVQVRELVLEHYGYDLTEGQTPCEDGVIHAMVNASATCFVGFAAHNSDPCDSVAPIALPCDTVCQEYSGKYLQASSSGVVTVYDDSACTTSPVALALTGNLDTRAPTNGALPDLDEYTSQLYA